MVSGILGGIAGGAVVAITIKAIDEFSGTFTKAGLGIKQLGSGMTALKVGAASAVAATAAITAEVVDSTNRFFEFNSAIQKAGVNVGASADELEIYKKQVLDISNVLGVTGQESAKVFEMLAGGTVSAEDAIKSLDETIKFARANNLSYEESIMITNQALTLFKVDAENVSSALDVLTRTSQVTSQKQSDLAMAMQEAGPIAAGLGINITDLSTILGGLGDAGVKGSEAGVALKRALEILINPSKQAQEALDELGISTSDISKNINQPIELLKIFEDRLKSIEDPLKKQALLADVFGQIAGPKMSLLLLQGTDALETIKEKLEESGGALEKTDQTVRESGNPWKELMSLINNFQIQIGAKLAPSIIKIVNIFKDKLLPALEPLIEPFSEIVIKIIEAAIPLFDVFIPLIVKMSDMFINRMLPAIEPIIPEIVELIEQIGNFAVTAWESLMPSIEELIPVIIELWNELKPIIPVLYEIIAAAIKLASVWLQMLLPAIKSILPILRVIIKPLEDVLGVIADIVDAIADAYNWVKKTMKLEEKNKKTATKNTIYGDDVIRLNDFILTKGGKIIETNPNDTIIGTKNPASLGNNIVINIDTVNGMDPDELAIALQKRLEVMIR